MKHVKLFEQFTSKVNNTNTFDVTVADIRISGTIEDYDGGSNMAKKFVFQCESKDPTLGFEGKYKDSFVLAMGNTSIDLYSLGNDIEKFMGIPEDEVIRDVNAGKENEDDAIIYGMCNMMNGGKDSYFWTNGTRLAGAAKKSGVLPAIIEQISHEAGVHLARTTITRLIAQSKGVSIKNEDWITYDYGGGEYMWPAVGDGDDPKNPIVLIGEEAFAGLGGTLCQIITNEFIKMASNYILNLKFLNV